MQIIRYKPWSPAFRVQEGVQNLLNEVLAPLPGEYMNDNSWTPAADFHEENDRFVIRMDVPGVDPQDVEVTLEDGTLSIKGERLSEHEAKDDDTVKRRIERSYGSFHRWFPLPKSADPEQVSASGKNGSLEVVIMKQEHVKSKRITVQA